MSTHETLLNRALALQPVLANLKATHGNNGLEIVYAYLDDCVLAGTAESVARAFADLQAAAANIGLKIAMGRDKSLLVPCAKHNADFDRSLFPAELCTQEDGNFELLGSPIGDPAHCRAHTAAGSTQSSRSVLSSSSSAPPHHHAKSSALRLVLASGLAPSRPAGEGSGAADVCRPTRVTEPGRVAVGAGGSPSAICSTAASTLAVTCATCATFASDRATACACAD